MNKGRPIPTRFDPEEDAALRDLKKRTGLPNAELVRRAVRLLDLRVKEEESIGFILDELSPGPKISYSKNHKKAARKKKKKDSR